jgi:hypothetical protein
MVRILGYFEAGRHEGSIRWKPKYACSRLGWEPLKIMAVGFLPQKDTGRRTKGPTACCSPQNNLSISSTYRDFHFLQDLF